MKTKEEVGGIYIAKRLIMRGRRLAVGSSVELLLLLLLLWLLLLFFYSLVISDKIEARWIYCSWAEYVGFLYPGNLREAHVCTGMQTNIVPGHIKL